MAKLFQPLLLLDGALVRLSSLRGRDGGGGLLAFLCLLPFRPRLVFISLRRCLIKLLHMIFEGRERVVIDEVNMIHTGAAPRVLDERDVAQVLPIQVSQLRPALVQGETLVILPLKVVIFLVLGNDLALFCVKTYHFFEILPAQASAPFERSESILS